MAKVNDLTPRDQEYWAKRFEDQASKAYAQGDRSLQELRNIFKNASQEMINAIGEFYSKYGTMQSSPVFTTLADGSKVISGTTNKLVVSIKDAKKALKKGTRLSNLERQLYNILLELSKSQDAYMKSTLAGIATEGYYNSIYEVYRGYSVGTSFQLLSPTVINQLITNPVNGQAFSTRIWNNRDRLANVVNQTLNAGITQGLSNREMAKRVSSDMGSGLSSAQRLIRTEVTNAYSQANKAGYDASGIVKQYEYIATLDKRTSDICTALDGQIFDVSEAVTGLNYPPMHPNCRSTTAAHFDDSKEGLTRIARTLGGNTFTVPASMTAADFKKIYVTKEMTREQWEAKRK